MFEGDASWNREDPKRSVACVSRESAEGLWKRFSYGWKRTRQSGHTLT